MNRRGFMSSILAAGMAPAVVGSGILMPLGKVWAPPVNASEVMWRLEALRQAELAANPAIVLIDALRNVWAYGIGGVYVDSEGMRALGPKEIYKLREDVALGWVNNQKALQK